MNSTNIFMLRPYLDHLPKKIDLPKGYIVRLFTQKDNKAELAALLTTTFDKKWTTELVEKKLLNAADVLATYVVTWNNTFVATASSRVLSEQLPHAGYVHWIGTHPKHRGKKLATALLDVLFSDFKHRGYQKAALETQDFRIPAIRMYLRYGFVPNYKNEDHYKRWSLVYQNMFKLD